MFLGAMLKKVQTTAFLQHSEAFKQLREDVMLSEDEKEAVANFTDMFITCSLNPDTVHDEIDLGIRIVEIVSTVNCHHCTNPCKNYSEKCKYGFPRFSLKKTIVFDKHEFEDEPRRRLM